MVGGHAFQEPFSPLSLLKPPGSASVVSSFLHTSNADFPAGEKESEKRYEKTRGSVLIFHHVLIFPQLLSRTLRRLACSVGDFGVRASLDEQLDDVDEALFARHVQRRVFLLLVFRQNVCHHEPATHTHTDRRTHA